MPGPSAATLAAEQLIDQRRFEQARAVLLRRLQTNPGDGYASNLLAVALTFSGNPDQALFHARRAHALLPDDLGVRSNLANVLSAAGRHADAIDHFRHVLRQLPGQIQVRHALGALLLAENRNAEAADLARDGLVQAPGDPTLINVQAGARLAAGHPGEALALFESGLKQHPEHPALLLGRATVSNYVHALDPQQIAASHRAAGVSIQSRAGTPLPPVDPAPRSRRPLRVGLVSSDLRRHSVAFFLEPLLRTLDRSKFEPIAFSCSAVEDAITTRLRRLVPEWHAIHALSDTDAAALIRRSRIDILIDLAGLGSGNRLGIFALAPAPLQVTYLGFPNTTGMTSIDCRLVDRITDPPGYEARCTERLIRLNHCFVCYSPLDQVLPDPQPRPRQAGDGPVFGSFNAFRKLTDQVIELWARTVASVPGARLVLKSAPLAEQRTRDDTAARFAAAGLDPARLELLGWVETDPMLLYRGIDVALDPFPYNGTTTTCEALWMGVPVVTLEGDTHAGRVGASLLTQVGLTELVARSPEDYAQTAAGLASDTGRLDALRRVLRPQAQERLGDGPAFSRDFEIALEDAWGRTVQ